METQNIIPVVIQPKASFRAKVVSVYDDNRGYFKRTSKRVLLSDVILTGVGHVYFPSTDYKNSSPETVEITLPKNIEKDVLARCEEDTSFAAAMIGGAFSPKGDCWIEFVADVAERNTESVSENGNWFNYQETILIRPRNARVSS
jgi:hypothetical protein